MTRDFNEGEWNADLTGTEIKLSVEVSVADHLHLDLSCHYRSL